MRITNNIISNDLFSNIQKSYDRMHDLENQVSSGKRIHKPSDNPVAVEKIIRLQSGLDRIDQWKNNIAQAIDITNTTDSVMGNLTTMMHRIKELALQTSSDTLTDSDRKAIKAEVEQISDEVINIANTKVGNRFIFAGTKTNASPASTLDGLWTGNESSIKYEVGNGMSIPVTVNGSTLFNKPPANSTKGLFQTLQALNQALDANDPAGITNTLGDLDANLDNINLLRADLGARTNRLTAIENQLETTETNMKQNLSTLEDTDMVKAIFDFKDQQKVFEAALSTGAQIVQMSLVDFMK